jgi:excinuclease ABC subunit B
MYANTITDSMRRAIDETNRRRAIQEAYNIEHNIVPTSIVKEVRDLTDRVRTMVTEEMKADVGDAVTLRDLPTEELNRMIKELEKEMRGAAQALEFEKAAVLRDQITELRGTLVERRALENTLIR